MPIVLGGTRRTRGKEGEYEFVSRTGAKFSVPKLTADDVAAICDQDRYLLADVPLQEILSFINRAGKNWRSDEYPRRILYVQQLQDILGYSEKAANAEADRIAILLNSHARMYDMIDAELGSRYIVDSWVPREEGYVRAFPRGLALHILPGNVPLSSALSLVRSLITKNVSVAKVGSTDPLTATALAMSLVDIDATHPVARSMNVVYWEHDSPEGLRITGSADAVCAWGGQEAIAFARRNAHDDAAVTCFGPKHSMALVDASVDPAEAARGLAHDVVIYDQQACFSMRRVFVTGPIEPFLTELRAALEQHTDLLPPGTITFDRAAHIQLSRQLDLFLGNDVEGDESLAWTIVTGPPPQAVEDHPLGRVIYVHPVESLRESYRFASPSLQTVAASPWSLLPEHRDELARRGVSRFVELGLAHLFRIGGTHDGVNALQGLVRMVGTEASGQVFGKGMVMKLDETTMLEAGTLKDLVL